MDHVILLGDSLTQQGYSDGWVSRMSDYYIRRARVINSGLSGYNTRWMRTVLADPTQRECVLPSYATEPLFVVFMMGGNDCAKNPRYGIPLDEFEENMRVIVSDLLANVRPRAGLFIGTPSPPDEVACAAHYDVPRDDFSFAGASTYCAAVRRIVDEFTAAGAPVALIDVQRSFLLYGRGGPLPAGEPAYEEGDSAPWKSLVCEDGLHFNERGGALMFATVLEAMRRSPWAAQLEPESVPMPVPGWKDCVGQPRHV